MENDAGETVHDLDHPYYGPVEKFVDGWIVYGRQIGDKCYWNIKLNVQSIFASRDLIPLNTQPDGMVGAWRIPPPHTFELSTSIDFQENRLYVIVTTPLSSGYGKRGFVCSRARQ